VENHIDRDRLLKFLGFGNPRAEAVFIGMEEGLTLPPPLDEQLVVRSAFTPMIDLAESAKAHLERFLSGDRPPIQPTWNLIIRILLALEGNRDASADQVRSYQRDRLGRTHERGALLELLPLPAPGISEWPYAELFPAYETRDRYRDDQMPKRIALLSEHLSYGPRIVVAYGSQYWDDFKKLFPRHREWQRSGPFALSEDSVTRVILTPHFTARQMNGQRGPLIDLVLRAKQA
jgi:hypothetical protein